MGKIIKIIEESAKKCDFSGAVSLSNRDRRIYGKGFGFRNIKEELKNNSTTKFGIASGIKFFTALGIGKLIEEIHLSFATKTKDLQIGGLVGSNTGLITESYAIGAIKGNEQIGVFVGCSYNVSIITKSYATGNVTGESGVVGLVGVAFSNINDSYPTGKVQGELIVGILLVINERTSLINRSYALGTVNGKEQVGGITGVTLGAVISSYYDVGITSHHEAKKGTPKNPEELMIQDTFASWDFDSVWAIDEELSYPYLQWEKIN